MPEGPEARSIVDILKQNILHGYIDSYVLTERAKAYHFEYLELPTQIINIRSHGKKVIIDCANNYSIVTSLGMSGRFQFERGNHSNICFNIGRSEIKGILNIIHPYCNLFFDDQRYFGGIDVKPTSEATSGLGPDLLEASLTTEITSEEWFNRFARSPSRKKIYDILTDQTKIAGIGWYLMTDILYYSGIHPERLGTSISGEEWELIRHHGHSIIKKAYQANGLTIRDYITPDGREGGYERAIYQRDFDVNGYVVNTKKVANKRTIHWVAEIQH